jgi:hypothetical protein
MPKALRTKESKARGCRNGQRRTERRYPLQFDAASRVPAHIESTVLSLKEDQQMSAMMISRVVSISALLGVLVGGGVAKARSCKPVHGTYSSMPVAPPACTSPVGFCTEGTTRGGLNGSYAFTMGSAIPSGERTTPGILFYTGVSLISPRGGGSLVGTDTGAIDVDPRSHGRMAALITITDGSDGYEGYSGVLQLVGKLDFATGAVSGVYSGELCRRR